MDEDIELNYGEVAAFRCPSCGSHVSVDTDPGELAYVRCIDCNSIMDRVKTR